jgi:hypothetical protein
MAIKTVIEFMDGVEREYPSRHMARIDGKVLRMTFNEGETIFPLINIRKINHWVVIQDGE